jgi:hypothetical protein
VSGSHVKFFEHAKRTLEPPFRVLAPLVPELVLFRLRCYSRWLPWAFFALRRRYRRICARTVA